MTTLFYLLAAVALVAFAVTFAAHWTARAYIRRRRNAGRLRPISVLKPLKGTDDHLYENLAAMARQDYPAFEIICGAADPDDPALAVARRVKAENPAVPIRVVSGAPDFGLNPKVTNLAHLAGHARHDLLLISDANVRPPADYLRAMVAELADPDVGLVHSVLAGVGEERLGAAFDNLHLCGWVAPAVCSATAWAGHPCVIGKSMLLARAALARIGGWDAIKNVLAEDYMTGRLMRAAGYRVALSPRPVAAVSARQTVGGFARRHLRWAQMRRRVSLPAYAGELLFNPIPLAALAMAAAAAAQGAVPELLFARVATALAVLKCASEASLATRLRGRSIRLRYLAAIPIKDALVVALWAVGAVRRTVMWRGTALRIGPDSALSPPRAGAARHPDALDYPDALEEAA